MVHPDPVPRDPKRRDLSRTLPAEFTPSSSPSHAACRVLPMGRSRRPRQDPPPASSIDLPEVTGAVPEPRERRQTPIYRGSSPMERIARAPLAARRRSWKEQRVPDPTWFIPPGPADREIHGRAPRAARPRVLAGARNDDVREEKKPKEAGRTRPRKDVGQPVNPTRGPTPWSRATPHSREQETW